MLLRVALLEMIHDRVTSQHEPERLLNRSEGYVSTLALVPQDAFLVPLHISEYIRNVVNVCHLEYSRSNRPLAVA
jgi:hypothetical protein